jgi:hypothetical protein
MHTSCLLIHEPLVALSHLKTFPSSCTKRSRSSVYLTGCLLVPLSPPDFDHKPTSPDAPLLSRAQMCPARVPPSTTPRRPLCSSATTASEKELERLNFSPSTAASSSSHGAQDPCQQLLQPPRAFDSWPLPPCDCRHGGRRIGRSHCCRRRGSCKAVAGRSEAHFSSGTCEACLGEQVEHEQVLSQQVRAAVRPNLGAHKTGGRRHGHRRPPRGPLPSTTSRGRWPNRRVAVTMFDDAR